MESKHWAACYLLIIVLLVSLASLASAKSCAHAGDCTSGFFCHSVGTCLSCDKCNKERNNLHWCQNECTGHQPSDGIASADSRRTLILSIVIPTGIVLLAAGVATGVGIRVRFLRRRPGTIPVMETQQPQQDAGQVQSRSTTPCAMPPDDHSRTPLLV